MDEFFEKKEQLSPEQMATLEQNLNNAYLSETDLNPRRIASMLRRRSCSVLDERIINARERLGRAKNSYLPLAEGLTRQLERSRYNSERKEFYGERLLGNLRLWAARQRELFEELAENAADTAIVYNGKNRISTTSSQGFGFGAYMNLLAGRLREKGIRTISMLESAEADTGAARHMAIIIFGGRYILPPPGVVDLTREKDRGKTKDDFDKQKLDELWTKRRLEGEENPLVGKSMKAVQPPTRLEVEEMLAKTIYAEQKVALDEKGVTESEAQTAMRNRERLSVLLSAITTAASVAKNYDDFMKLIEIVCFSPLPNLMLADYRDIVLSSEQQVVEYIRDGEFMRTLKQAYFREAQSRIKVVSQGTAETYLEDETLLPLDLLADSDGFRRKGPLMLSPDGVVDDGNGTEEKIKDVASALFLKHGLVVNMFDLLLNGNYCSQAIYMPASYHLSRRLFQYLDYKGDVAPRIKIPGFELKGLMPNRYRETAFEKSNALIVQIEGPSLKRIEEEILRILSGQLSLSVSTSLYSNYSSKTNNGKAEDPIAASVLATICETLRKTRFLPEEIKDIRRGRLEKKVKKLPEIKRLIDDGLEASVLRRIMEASIENMSAALPRRRMVGEELELTKNVLKEPLRYLSEVDADKMRVM